MVAPPDKTSGQTSSVAGRDGEDGRVLSSGKGFDTLSQFLAGKSENCVVGEADNHGLSDSDSSISPMIEFVSDNSVSTMSKVVSFETTMEEEGIEKDGVDKFENLSVDVKEKEVVDDEKESENEVKSVEEDDERSLVSGEDDDDEKRYQVLVEEEIVKFISSESVNVVDKKSPCIEELEDLAAAYDGDFELRGKETSEVVKVEIGEKKESSIVVNTDAKAEVNNVEEVRDKILVSDIVSTCEFSDVAKDIYMGSSGGEEIVNLTSSEFVNVGKIDNHSEAVKKEKSMVDAKEDSKAEVESHLNKVREVSEVNNVEQVGEKILVSDIVSTCEFSAEDKEIDKGSSGREGVVGFVGVSDSNEVTKEMIFGSYKAAGLFLDESEKASFGNDKHSDETSILSNELDKIDGHIVSDSDDESEETKFNPAVVAAFLKAITGGSSDGSNLSSSLRLMQSRPTRFNVFLNPQVAMGGESESNLSEEEKQKLEKLQSIRVKYLRLVQRLGKSVDDSIATQVLYRLALIAGRNSGQLFSLDTVKEMVRESEAEGKEDLKFSLNILVLGKSGVGKSATINSILGEQKVSTDAFGPSTTSVRKISGTVNGVEITIIETPGLKPYAMDQSINAKMLDSVKKVMKKCPPDVVLYVDRLDAQNRGLNNMSLLRTITTSLDSSIWENAIVTLTHAASAPPDGPSGTPLSYDVFVSQCSHIVQ